MTNITIRRNNDPFKKYWWVLLAIFAVTAGWVCLPLFDTGTGSTAVSRDQGLKSAEQSLDGVSNQVGAPGSAVDLAMTGAYARKNSKGGMTSSLYQAPPGAVAAGVPLTETGKDLANALKDIGKRSASAAHDESGWGGEKAQAGFTAPKANFGALSGLGSSGSGSSAASSGGGGGGHAGVSAFGTPTPKTGFATTQGLSGQNAAPAKAGSGTLKALQSAASISVNAANKGSLDAARSLSGQNFDGGGGAGSVAGAGASAAALNAGGGVYGSLDAAPSNLKGNDPNLNKKDMPVPPAKPVDTKQSMADQIKLMIVQALVTGICGLAMNGLGAALGLGSVSVSSSINSGGKTSTGGSSMRYDSRNDLIFSHMA